MTVKERRGVKAQAIATLQDVLPKIKPWLTADEYGALCALAWIDWDWDPTPAELAEFRQRAVDAGIINDDGSLRRERAS